MTLGAEEMVKALSETTGQNLVFDGEGCDVVVGGRAMVLRYRPQEGAWYAIGVLGKLKPVGHPYRMEVMQAALEANFMGRYTMGMQLSIFADTLLIADRIEAAELTASALAERLVRMTQNLSKILEDWTAYRNYTETAKPEAAEPPVNDFWSFIRV